MSKIEEFEQKIIMHGMVEGDFEEFKKLLRRVRSNFLKRQHCYTTAIQLPIENSSDAIRLIEYGLMNFEDGWYSTYTSYRFMGDIYRNSKQYEKAYICYEQALDALGENKQSYVENLASDLFWVRLHIDEFEFTDEFKKHFTIFMNADNFTKAFINNEYVVAIGELVHAIYSDNVDMIKVAYDKAMRILEPGYKGKLHDILKKHKYTEKLQVTSESLDFLETVKSSYGL